MAVTFSGPFKYDIVRHIRTIRDRIWADAIRPRDIMAVPRLCDQNSSPPIRFSGKRPESSTLNAEDTTTAAFVLDYLRHNGHDTSLNLTRRAMAKRGWISSLPDMPVSSSKALAALRESILQPNSSVKADDMTHLLAGGECSDTIKNRFQIFEIINLLWVAGPFDETKADRLVSAAIDLGKTLLGRSKEDSWVAKDRTLLNDAFCLLSIPTDQWDTGWAKRREKFADEVVESVRSKSRLSCLTDR